MGNRLVRECIAKFMHLNGNPYKALIWMCLRTLDDPDPSKGIPAGLWFADWPELATAIGWQARLDAATKPEAMKMLRDDVGKVCRELVAAGAIEKVPHPNRIDNAAYVLVLKPKKPERKPKRGRRRVGEPVDNLLQLDFGTVDAPDEGAGENHLRGAGENHLRPINRNQEQTEEQRQEGGQEKGEDQTNRPGEPPDRARPVDNSSADVWSGTIAGVREKLAASAARNARHARPAPVGNARPDRE